MEYKSVDDRRKCGSDLMRKEFAAHAPRLVFVIDDDSRRELGMYNEGLALSIFRDGEVMMTENVYDSSREEYAEKVIAHYKGKEKDQMIVKIDEMFRAFPCSISGKMLHCYNDAVNLLKEDRNVEGK